MKLLIIDNYDSFTYNLVHDLERVADVNVDVVRNDEVDTLPSNFDAYIISPGPGLPSESGNLVNFMEQLRRFNKPVLGVCLGLQAMAEFTGGKLMNLGQVRHGTPWRIRVLGESKIYLNTPDIQEVGLYHSWAVERNTLSTDWQITALSDEDVVMSMQHTSLPWVAVQYHPESVLSEYGRRILENWCKSIGKDDQSSN